VPAEAGREVRLGEDGADLGSVQEADVLAVAAEAVEPDLAVDAAMMLSRSARRT